MPWTGAPHARRIGRRPVVSLRSEVDEGGDLAPPAHPAVGRPGHQLHPCRAGPAAVAARQGLRGTRCAAAPTDRVASRSAVVRPDRRPDAPRSPGRGRPRDPWGRELPVASRATGPATALRSREPWGGDRVARLRAAPAATAPHAADRQCDPRHGLGGLPLGRPRTEPGAAMAYIAVGSVFLVATSVVMTWVFNHTGGSLV